jgi:Protein of unknown function (DUF3108)
VGRCNLELPGSVTIGAAARQAPSRLRGALTVAVASIVLTMASANSPARADEVVATYSVYWAGLPAAQIRLRVSDAATSYNDEIEILTGGLPRVITHFRGKALAVGRFVPGKPADPLHYDALYDLRKRHNSRIGMHFIARDGGTIAERTADDTSRKPALAERFRRDIVDPLTAFERIRAAIIARGAEASTTFTVPVYDGARRFDVLGRILPRDQQSPGVLKVTLSLRPIAGFKGESSDDSDPDDAPRPVALSLTDDSRLLPVSMTVRVFYLPLVVRLDQVCPGSARCSG